MGEGLFFSWIDVGNPIVVVKELVVVEFIGVGKVGVRVLLLLKVFIYSIKR